MQKPDEVVAPACYSINAHQQQCPCLIPLCCDEPCQLFEPISSTLPAPGVWQHASLPCPGKRPPAMIDASRCSIGMFRISRCLSLDRARATALTMDCGGHGLESLTAAASCDARPPQLGACTRSSQWHCYVARTSSTRCVTFWAGKSLLPITSKGLQATACADISGPLHQMVLWSSTITLHCSRSPVCCAMMPCLLADHNRAYVRCHAFHCSVQTQHVEQVQVSHDGLHNNTWSGWRGSWSFYGCCVSLSVAWAPGCGFARWPSRWVSMGQLGSNA